jgi:hypothetical protein
LDIAESQHRQLIANFNSMRSSFSNTRERLFWSTMTSSTATATPPPPIPDVPPHPMSIHGNYEALAHLLVGGLFGAWLATRKSWLLFTGIGITAVEIICAAASFVR